MDNQEESNMICDIEEKPAGPDGIVYDTDNEIREFIRNYSDKLAASDYKFYDYPSFLSEIRDVVGSALLIDLDQAWVVDEEAKNTFFMWQDVMQEVLSDE